MPKVKITKAPTGSQADYGLVRKSNVPQTGDSDRKVKNTMTALKGEDRAKANIEVEGGETVLGDVNRDGYVELFEFKGKRHSNGGMDVDIPEGSFIFSDTKKLKIKDKEMLKQYFGLSSKRGGYTPAEISKKFQINEFIDILKNPESDEMAKRSANEMIKNNMQKLGLLAFVQESIKGFPDGVPDIAQIALSELGVDANQMLQEAVPEQPEQNQEMMMNPNQMPMGKYGGKMKYPDGGGLPTSSQSKEYFDKYYPALLDKLNTVYGVDFLSTRPSDVNEGTYNMLKGLLTWSDNRVIPGSDNPKHPMNRMLADLQSGALSDNDVKTILKYDISQPLGFRDKASLWAKLPSETIDKFQQNKAFVEAMRGKGYTFENGGTNPLMKFISKAQDGVEVSLREKLNQRLGQAMNNVENDAVRNTIIANELSEKRANELNHMMEMENTLKQRLFDDQEMHERQLQLERGRLRPSADELERMQMQYYLDTQVDPNSKGYNRYVNNDGYDVQFGYLRNHPNYLSWAEQQGIDPWVYNTDESMGKTSNFLSVNKEYGGNAKYQYAGGVGNLSGVDLESFTEADLMRIGIDPTDTSTLIKLGVDPKRIYYNTLLSKGFTSKEIDLRSSDFNSRLIDAGLQNEYGYPVEPQSQRYGGMTHPLAKFVGGGQLPQYQNGGKKRPDVGDVYYINNEPYKIIKRSKDFWGGEYIYFNKPLKGFIRDSYYGAKGDDNVSDINYIAADDFDKMVAGASSDDNTFQMGYDVGNFGYSNRWAPVDELSYWDKANIFEMAADASVIGSFRNRGEGNASTLWTVTDHKIDNATFNKQGMRSDAGKVKLKATDEKAKSQGAVDFEIPTEYVTPGYEMKIGNKTYQVADDPFVYNPRGDDNAESQGRAIKLIQTEDPDATIGSFFDTYGGELTVDLDEYLREWVEDGQGSSSYVDPKSKSSGDYVEIGNTSYYRTEGTTDSFYWYNGDVKVTLSDPATVNKIKKAFAEKEKKNVKSTPASGRTNQGTTTTTRPTPTTVKRKGPITITYD